MGDEPRGRGILTVKDREYLADQEAYRKKNSRQAAHERKKSLRERAWNGFLDGSVLLEHTTPDERREIFRGWEDFSDPVDWPTPDDRPDSFGDISEFRGEIVEKARADSGFSSWLAFLYLGLSESDEFDFEAALRTGIERAEESRGRIVTDLDFHVDAREERSLDELKSRFQRQARLTTEEIQRLRAADEVTDAELVTYYDELAAPTLSPERNG